MQTLETVLTEYFNAIKNSTRSLPLYLGGISAPSGGTGGPPGGFIGKLPQTQITYDLTELATDYTPLSGYTLLDNLNHIRYRLGIIESGGSSSLMIMEDGSPIASGVTVINFEGDFTVTPIPSGVTVTMVAVSGLEDAPIDGSPYVRQDGAWTIITVPDALADLADDSTHRLVTDTEKSTWNAKQNALIADVDYLTPSTAGSTYEPIKGIDDNYVTDAEKTVIGNTSGTNSGDVTVLDTATIDLTLAGQQISADVIESGIQHDNLSGAGVNSHAQIDTVISGLDNEYLKLDASNGPITGSLGIGVAAEAKLHVKGTSSSAIVDTDNLLTADGTFTTDAGWTYGTGWASGGGVVTHSTGNTATLSGTSTATDIVKVYQINFTVAVTTAGNGFNVSLGGKDSGTLYNSAGAKVIYIRPIDETGTLLFTPAGAGTFVGTLDNISIYEILISTADLLIEPSDVTSPRIEIRAGGNTTNTLSIGKDAGRNTVNLAANLGINNIFIGNLSGRYNASGSFNVAIGNGTLGNNVTGHRNMVIGEGAMSLNISGFQNTALGYQALYNSLSAQYNIAIGLQALYTNTTGYQNVCIGTYALTNLASFYYSNTAIGNNAGRTLTSAYQNVFIGETSGYHASQVANVANCVAIGTNTYTTGSNGIAIGFGAIAAGNTVVLGNTSHTMTYLYGDITPVDGKNIILGTTTGMKIGTATGQKLGFWNATPVVQQVLATGTGKTVDNVITFLQTLGLCKQS